MTTSRAVERNPVEELLAQCTVEVRSRTPGSGFFISPTLVVTCAHVVGWTSSIGDPIAIATSAREHEATIAWRGNTSYTDIAVLRLRTSGQETSPGVPWARTGSEWRIGDEVYVAGVVRAPGGGIEQNGEIGRISALIEPTDRSGLPFIKLSDARLERGFSGGPVLHRGSGTIIGVASWSVDPTDALGGAAIQVPRFYSVDPTLAELTYECATTDIRWLNAQRQELTNPGRPGGIRSAHLHEGAIESFVCQTLGAADERRPFGGRDDELGVLTRWLERDDGPPRMLIFGDAGIGKSSLLVNWLESLPESHPTTEVALVPLTPRIGMLDEERVLRTAVSRLAWALARPLPREPHGTADDWRSVLADLLCCSAPSGRTVVIAIDGLDEAEWASRAGAWPSHLGDGLRLVATARPTQDLNTSERWLDRLGWQHDNGATRMSVTALTERGVAHVVNAVELPPPPAELATSWPALLHQLSDGDPLVLSMYLQEFSRPWQSKETVDLSDLTSRSAGLTGFFEYWWEEQEARWRGADPLALDLIEDVLAVLALANEPLSVEVIKDVLGPGGHRRLALREGLRRVDRLVARDPRTQSYSYVHSRLSGHLIANQLADRIVEVNDLFLALGERVSTSAASSRPLSTHTLEYVCRNLHHHLAKLCDEESTRHRILLGRHFWAASMAHDSTSLDKAAQVAWDRELALHLRRTEPAAAELVWLLRAGLTKSSTLPQWRAATTSVLCIREILNPEAFPLFMRMTVAGERWKLAESVAPLLDQNVGATAALLAIAACFSSEYERFMGLRAVLRAIPLELAAHARVAIRTIKRPQRAGVLWCALTVRLAELGVSDAVTAAWNVVSDYETRTTMIEVYPPEHIDELLWDHFRQTTLDEAGATSPLALLAACRGLCKSAPSGQARSELLADALAIAEQAATSAERTDAIDGLCRLAQGNAVDGQRSGDVADDLQSILAAQDPEVRLERLRAGVWRAEEEALSFAHEVLRTPQCCAAGDQAEQLLSVLAHISFDSDELLSLEFESTLLNLVAAVDGDDRIADCICALAPTVRPENLGRLRDAATRVREPYEADRAVAAISTVADRSAESAIAARGIRDAFLRSQVALGVLHRGQRPTAAVDVSRVAGAAKHVADPSELASLCAQMAAVMTGPTRLVWIAKRTAAAKSAESVKRGLVQMLRDVEGADSYLSVELIGQLEEGLGTLGSRSARVAGFLAGIELLAPDERRRAYEFALAAARDERDRPSEVGIIARQALDAVDPSERVRLCREAMDRCFSGEVDTVPAALELAGHFPKVGVDLVLSPVGLSNVLDTLPNLQRGNLTERALRTLARCASMHMSRNAMVRFWIEVVDRYSAGPRRTLLIAMRAVSRVTAAIHADLPALVAREILGVKELSWQKQATPESPES